MHGTEVTRPQRGLGLALVLAVVVGCGALSWNLATCSSHSGPGMAPSLVWDGTSFTAAWAADDGRNVAVWSYRWTPGESSTKPRSIAKVNDLFSPPELVRGDSAYLLALNLGDDGILTVPLERSDVEAQAAPIEGPVRTMCRAPVSMGRQFAIAFGVGVGDGIDYHFALVDEGGTVIDRGHLGGGTAARPGCAIGYYKGTVGVAYTLDAPNGRQHLALAMPGDTFEVGTASELAPLRLVGAADGWHLLYGQADQVGLVHIGRDGGVVGDRMLASDIPADTVDFAAGAAGRAVAWTVPRKVWLAPLDDDGLERGRCGFSRPPSLSPARLIAAGDGWGVGWTELNGRTVAIGKIRGCNGDAMIVDHLTTFAP